MNDTNIVTAWEVITPAIAQMYLSKQTGNRKINQNTVKRYAGDMVNGDWLTTHQGIAIDGKGCLLDGQHRLLAIIESGRSVNMLVSKGVAREAAADMDSGMMRSTQAQIMIGYGRTIPSQSIGIIKFIHGLYGDKKPSTPRIIVAYNKNQVALEEVRALTNARNLSTAPQLAAYIVAASSGVPMSSVIDFHQCLLHLDGKSSPASARLNSILQRERAFARGDAGRVKCFILTGISLKRHIDGVDKKMPSIPENLSVADFVYKGNPLA
jgi:hypothetical protein